MIEALANLWGSVGTLLETHGILAIAIVLLIEEMGVPSPIPGDLLMLLAGIRVAQGAISLPAVLLIESLSTFTGSSLLYFAARRGGRLLVLRYGRFVGATPERLAAAERKIAGREMATVFLGRLIPGLRSVTVMTAGVMGVPPRQFFPAVFVGGFGYLAFYTVLGALVGPPILRFFAQIAFPASALWSLGGVAVVALAIRELRRFHAGRLTLPLWATFLLGGLLAGMAGLLAANFVTGVVETVVRAVGRPSGLGISRSLDELHVLLGWPSFLLLAMGIGAAYRRFGLRNLPLTLRVSITACAPLVVTLLATMVPLLAAEPGPARTIAMWLLVPAAVVRWLGFGIALECLPLDRPRAAAVAARDVPTGLDAQV